MKTKKLLALFLTLALSLSLFALTVFADSETVYVSISDGTLQLAYAAVPLSDTDGDGTLTINDALYRAHELYFEGGVDGYGSASTDYGLSLTKLWGDDNGGSLGYYLNNASALSLADPVKDGDHIYAYAYSDLVAWSDTYSYFNVNTATVNEGEELKLTLSAAGFDENWAPITKPVEGAKIVVNGKETSYVTDANGNVAIKTNGFAQYTTITAVSDSMTLVPPVCLVTVNSVNPPTGDITAFVILFAALAFATLATAIFVRKNEN